MANATAITVNALTANTVLTQPTANILDTGTAAVTIGFTPDGDSHNVLLEVTNTALAADLMTVDILAGVRPPAVEASLGNVTFTVAQNAVRYIVVDSSRCMQADGKINVMFTPASTKAQTMTIRAYKLPK